MDLNTPIRQGSRIYKIYANRLAKLGIAKIEDFLYHIPFRYDDYSLVTKINKVQPGETVTIVGEVLEIKNIFTRRYKKIQKAQVKDSTGAIEVIWFNQPFIVNIIKKGSKVSLSGKIVRNVNKNILQSPEYEVIENDEQNIHTGRLVPVYPETKGITSKWLRKQVYWILKDKSDKLNDFLPKDFLKKENLISLKTAIENVHFPKNLKEAETAKERLSFDELLLMQLNGAVKKQQWQEIKTTKKMEIEKFQKQIEEYILALPFELTNAQKKAIEEILKDLNSEKSMNRLLEGDVGSGKTVVATVAVYLSYLNKLQSVLMAPTEILAIQHYQTIRKLLEPLGVKVELKTSSSKKTKEKKSVCDVIVGTHAVIHNKINFKNLGLVIIDEQQRFGVEQRAILRSKGDNPHFLTMTATPIPRTVALTMYGDLDLSYLDEMPKGRKVVKTWLIGEERRLKAYKWIEEQIIKNKDQAFIICPFIEESESMITVKAATKEFEKLKKEIFPKLKLALLHGRMKAAEKEEVLKKFKAGKFDILVATPVVEVGIDIANATIMLIEAAERFGLSQLHQLRGRVGRGEKQSYCLLFSEGKNPKTIERLTILENVYAGAELAEYDLKLRGQGNIYGTSQHGVPALKVADFSDFNLIKRTKIAAEKIIKDLNKYPQIREKMENYETSEISPD